MRLAIIHKDKCKLWHGCDFLCQKYCPIARDGGEIFQIENDKPVIVEKLCIGCGICVNRCPYNAISIINLPEALKINPIHRYGKNGFELFNLPAPRFNAITGILGVNGIGKSTIFKILSRTIVPNFGNPDEKLSQEEAFKRLSQIYKGKEEQSIFLEMASSFKVAYKIQDVNVLVKHFGNAKVEELLKKADEKNKFDDVVTQLNLKPILDRKINQLSGGEFQKILIAATSLKDAKLYLYDEPSSYLDIKERLKVAKYLKETVKDNALMIVEHDLIMLDYLADYIYILYGKSKEYGIVSMIKSAKKGINQYLNGFLKEENMRFRDYKLNFIERNIHRNVSNETLLSWKNLSVDFGSFKLNALEGDIRKTEIIGILGENGIGKTTFIKALGNMIKYEGEIEGNVKIAYKPQYLEVENPEMLVKEFLKDAIINYEKELIRGFKVYELLERKLSELSGGELQKVLIVKALSEDGDLFLLDEPTAYLDVEERLNVAKAILDFLYVHNKSAFVIDHDLMFIDYISNRVIVVDGIKAKQGNVLKPMDVDFGLNLFLQKLGITLRRDVETKRPRINKEGSRLDKLQKANQKFI